MKRIRSSLKGTSQNVFYSLKRGHRRQLSNTQKSIKSVFIKNVNNISDRYGNAWSHFRWQPPYWPLWSMTLSHEYNPIIKTWWTMATRHIRGDLQLKCFSNIVFTHKRLHNKFRTHKSQDNTHAAMRLDIFIWPIPKLHCILNRHRKILLISLNRTWKKPLQSDRLKLFN